MLRPFEYFAPETLAEASDLLVHLGPHARVLAGGTALLLSLERDSITVSGLVSLRRIPGLRDIHFDPDTGLTLGALVTLSELIRSETIQRHVPALAHTADGMASPQVRNLASVGGNLCGALPAADLAVTLLALDAALRVSGPNGERTIALDKFFLLWGGTALALGEILTEIHVPPPRGPAAYHKFMTRQAVDVALANVAVCVHSNGDRVEHARIVVGASGPRPVRAIRAEQTLYGQRLDQVAIDRAARLAAMDACPSDDPRASRWYRRELIGVLTRRALHDVETA